MNESDKVSADINHIFNKVIESSPETQKLFTPDYTKLVFPGGPRWHFFKLNVGKRYYMYCYSTVRNSNGKFLSWTYKPHYETVRDKGKYRKVQAWKYVSLRETRRYKSAKDRAYKKAKSHKRKLEQAAEKRCSAILKTGS